MQWTSSIRNSADDLNNNNKAAIKRTFDQISEGSSTSTKSSQSTTLNEENNKILDVCNVTGEETKDQTINDETSIVRDENSVDNEPETKEPVTFKVVYAKEIFELTRDKNETILILKNHLQKLTSVNHSSQKLCYKGKISRIIFYFIFLFIL